MPTFIRMAEAWLPSADGTVLEHGGGIYRAAPEFGALSRQMRFAPSEGLPGHAWTEGQPLLLSPLAGSYFCRTEAAADAGVACAIALPFFAGDRLTSVAVLLCADAAQRPGAVEVWQSDARVTGDLRLEQGYYGPSGSALRELSQDTWLPRGQGAPGLAWQHQQAVFIDDVQTSGQFLRAQTAATAGLVRALALPSAARGYRAWVVSLLGSTQSPIARRVESWLPVPGTATLQRAFGFSERLGRLPVGDAAALPAAALGAIETARREARAVCDTALPWIEPGDSALTDVLALPVIDGDEVSEVVALYF